MKIRNAVSFQNLSASCKTLQVQSYENSPNAIWPETLGTSQSLAEQQNRASFCVKPDTVSTLGPGFDVTRQGVSLVEGSDRPEITTNNKWVLLAKHFRSVCFWGRHTGTLCQLPGWYKANLRHSRGLRYLTDEELKSENRQLTYFASLVWRTVLSFAQFPDHLIHISSWCKPPKNRLKHNRSSALLVIHSSSSRLSHKPYDVRAASVVKQFTIGYGYLNVHQLLFSDIFDAIASSNTDIWRLATCKTLISTIHWARLVWELNRYNTQNKNINRKKTLKMQKPGRNFQTVSYGLHHQTKDRTDLLNNWTFCTPCTLFCSSYSGSQWHFSDQRQREKKWRQGCLLLSMKIRNTHLPVCIARSCPPLSCRGSSRREPLLRVRRGSGRCRSPVGGAEDVEVTL